MSPASVDRGVCVLSRAVIGVGCVLKTPPGSLQVRTLTVTE